MTIRIMSGKSVLTTFGRGEDGTWGEKGVKASADYKRYVDRVNPVIEKYNRQLIEGVEVGARPVERVGNWGHDNIAPRFEVHLINDRPSGMVAPPQTAERHPGQLAAMRAIRGLPEGAELIERWVYKFPGLTVRHEKLTPILDKLESVGIDRISLEALRSRV